MKNIHVLKTNKPSRLVLDTVNNNLFLTTTKDFGTNIMKFQNIYITNDEEIKEGDWGYFISTNEVVKVPLGGFKGNVCRKIIFTTDQDLIKNGVQETSEEFLQWFAKNPSCEEVEVKTKQHFEADKSKRKNILNGVYYSYKIIIPKEEPKQELRKVCKCKRAYESPLSEICSLCWNELYPNEKDEIKDEDLLEPKQELERGINIIHVGKLKQETFEEKIEKLIMGIDVDTGYRVQLKDLISKQETLEEVAEKLANDFPVLEVRFNMSNEEINGWFLEALQKGAKWQQKQDKNKYSDEEVIELLNKREDCINQTSSIFEYTTAKEWFEQFKKK
jgi:hypothetical protein